MPDLQSDLAPVSDAVTNGVRVEVLSRHSPENSRPNQDEWVFQYTVRITNQGTGTVQLLSRHWVITDALEHTEEVQGPGVVVPPQDADRNDARHLSDGPQRWKPVRYRDRPLRSAGAIPGTLTRVFGAFCYLR
jgi:hypothetical protein